jgi:hypothetical protein
MKEKRQVELLYQKLGDRWFVFSWVQEELLVGSVSQEEIESGEMELDDGEARG